MKPLLLVGCPVLRREWIMPTWFTHVEASCAAQGIEPEYIFVGDRRDPTRQVIEANVETLDRTVHFVDIIDEVGTPHSHEWGNPINLERMVGLRNYLLEGVRELEPEMFLSLDSDILVHEELVGNLIDTLFHHELNFAAVGGKVYLSEGLDHPSWASYSRRNGLKRHDMNYVCQVDVIMAVKLMSSLAYNVDYEFERNGEDIGWSLACAERGLRLGFDGRVVSKHIMHQVLEDGSNALETIDPRVGY